MKALIRWAVPYLAYGYISFVGWTSRIRWSGKEFVQEALRGQGGYIYAFWHNRQVLFTYTHRNEPAAVMVSKSADGDIIAKVMSLSHISAVRGSSSRAALGATRELVEAAERGVFPAISPDGPKGPAFKVKSGVLYLAQKTGFPIIPIANAASRKLVFRKAWDRFQVPLPFSRCAVTHGPPIHVSPSDDLGAKAKELEEAITRVTEEADRSIAS